MTKDILLLTATMLNLDDVITHLSSEDMEASEDTKKTEGELIAYLNYVLSSITKEYMTLETIERVTSDAECQIAYEKLSKSAVSISKVILCGSSVTFNLYPEYIKVGRPNQEYEVLYYYTPNKVKELSDKVEMPLGLSDFVLCYGIASEYALSKLLYDEAAMWQAKFVNSLEKAKLKGKEKRFYARKLK